MVCVGEDMSGVCGGGYEWCVCGENMSGVCGGGYEWCVCGAEFVDLISMKA